jgi:hypothetical protein
MPKNRNTQHKPSRDTAHAKELADNRREITHLTREVARLKRYIEKLEANRPDTEEPETLASADPKSVPLVPGKACGKCGSTDVRYSMTTPTGMSVSVCHDCKALVRYK